MTNRPQTDLSSFGLPQGRFKIPLFHWRYLLPDILRSMVFCWHLRDRIRHRLKRTKTFLFELTKMRLLSKHRDIWVVDQGWVQNLLSARASRQLSFEDLQKWLRIYSSLDRNSVYIIVKETPMDILVKRISNSEKHLIQSRNSSASDYACRHHKATEETKSILSKLGIEFTSVGDCPCARYIIGDIIDVK